MSKEKLSDLHSLVILAIRPISLLVRRSGNKYFSNSGSQARVSCNLRSQKVSLAVRPNQFTYLNLSCANHLGDQASLFQVFK